jgi:hypothetical protein
MAMPPRVALHTPWRPIGKPGEAVPGWLLQQL